MRGESMKCVRAGERGAISIATLLSIVAAGTVLFLIIKFVPIYTEQRRIIFDVDELANKATIRNTKEEDLAKQVKKLVSDNDLPGDSIQYMSRDKRIEIVVGYTRSIDLVVTTYDWRVDHKAIGKGL